MKPLFLQPHSDDAVLFACYTLLDVKPHVVTCLGGGAQRTLEDKDAFATLGIDWFREWNLRERDPNAQAKMEAKLALLADVYPYVYAPAYEDGGHEEHNAVALAALNTFGPTRTRGYMTYRRGHARSRGTEVVPRKEWWVSHKFRAMGCYTSQIEQASTRPWFNDWEKEWLA